MMVTVAMLLMAKVSVFMLMTLHQVIVLFTPSVIERTTLYDVVRQGLSNATLAINFKVSDRAQCK